MKIETSHSHYISLKSALNVPDPTGNSGDWHPYYLEPRYLEFAGEHCAVNTLPYFDELGLHDASKLKGFERLFLSELWDDFDYPVYVASHIRANLDLLYRDFVVHQGDGRSVDMYGWMDDADDLKKIMALFERVVLKHRLDREWRLYCAWLWNNFS